MLTTCSVVSVTFSASLHFHTNATHTNACQTTFTEWCRLSETHHFQQETQKGVLSNANIEIVFHSRLAEIVKDVYKAEFLLLMLASLSSSNSTFEIISVSILMACSEKDKLLRLSSISWPKVTSDV